MEAAPYLINYPVTFGLLECRIAPSGAEKKQMHRPHTNSSYYRFCVLLSFSPLKCITVSGVLRQECCSGLPFPSPGDLSNPGIKPEYLMSPAFFITSATWEAQKHLSKAGTKLHHTCLPFIFTSPSKRRIPSPPYSQRTHF